MLPFARRLACFLLLSSGALAQEIEPARVPIDTRTVFALGADGATTLTMRRADQVRAFPVEADGSVPVRLMRFDAGAWWVTLEGPDFGALTLQQPITLWRPNRLTVVPASGEPAIPFPLTATVRQAIIDVVLLEEDLPVDGAPSGFELQVDGTAPVLNAVTVRWRRFAGSALESDASQSTGWDFESTVSAPESSGGQLLLWPDARAPFPTSGNVLASFVMARNSTGGSSLFLQSAGDTALRCRTPWLTLATPLATSWNGAFPVQRPMWSARPALVVRYPGPAAFGPGFTPSLRQVLVGEPVRLNNTTIPGATGAHWDLDGDGRVDVSGISPDVSWATPGLKTIEMVVRFGDVIDSVRCVDCVEVLAGGGSSLAVF